MTRDSYSYLHLSMVGSIIFIALGIEQTLAHVGERLGTVVAVALFGGGTLSLLGHAFRFRDHGTVSVLRLVVAAAALVLISVAVRVPSIVALVLSLCYSLDLQPTKQ